MLSNILFLGVMIFIFLGMFIDTIASHKFKKVFINKILSFFNHPFLYYFLIVICFISMLVNIVLASNESSPNNYICTLQTKKVIEMELDKYETDINAYLSGNVDSINFSVNESLVELNQKIIDYNDKILKHKNYKDSFWLQDYYNADIARLNTFDVIFNKQEE